MNLNTRKLRLSILTAFIVSVLPTPAFAAEQDATFELYPHCAEREDKDDEWMFGPIPSPGIVLETRDVDNPVCTTFEVEDPQTLRTRNLRKGDILDIDLVIDNPSGQNIERVRVWLSYDPNMLEGEFIEIHSTFGIVTPDEKDFSPSEGYAKMEARTDGTVENDEKILFARIQFRVKETNSIGTPITFHDVQPDGHSVIMTKTDGEESYIVKEEPGVLLVKFAEDVDTDEGDIENIFDTVPEPDPVPPPPEDVLEVEEVAPLLDNGANCEVDIECKSSLCGSGICIPSLTDNAPPRNTNPDQGSDERTAFSLLQIRNLRITTDGSSVFLAWDPLQSSQLKANTVYYSKNSGQYMQRRTIDRSENSLTVRSLEIGKRYYFAVRALSKQNEESAFSREVSIVIGDPNSSTAPLVLGSIGAGPGKNPVANILNEAVPTPVPGATGLPSAVVLFLVGSAIIGTSFASRRQFVVSKDNPYE